MHSDFTPGRSYQVMFIQIPENNINYVHFPCHNVFCGTPAIKFLLFSESADYNLSNNTFKKHQKFALENMKMLTVKINVKTSFQI